MRPLLSRNRGRHYNRVMDRRELVEWWDEAADGAVWWAPWSRAVEGLTAEQAAWKPAPDRHSIWQLVNHMSFWREYLVHRAEGGAPSTEEDLHRQNWQEPAEVSEEAWRAARSRFTESHAKVRAVLANPATPPPPEPELDLRYLLPHDSYHVGQIMFIRALLGMKPLES
jgi:uncharacterized damage-inducible protein DinB